MFVDEMCGCNSPEPDEELARALDELDAIEASKAILTL